MRTTISINFVDTYNQELFKYIYKLVNTIIEGSVEGRKSIKMQTTFRVYDAGKQNTKGITKLRRRTWRKVEENEPLPTSSRTDEWRRQITYRKMEEYIFSELFNN